MAGAKGYHSYRGRESRMKLALAAVLVLVILASVGVIAMQNYLVYDENGAPHLQLPRREPPAEPEPEEEVNLTIQPSEKTAALRALSSGEMPLTDWDGTTLARTLTDAGANAWAVTLKDETGQVYFDAKTADAAPFVKTTAATAAALAAAGESGIHTVARISCFLDPLAANADVEGKGLKNTGGYIFYDGNNHQWLDPGKPAARQYLCALAAEAAALGFDEILLTDVTYPTAGKLDKIDYGETMKAQNLTTFLAEMHAALEEYNVTLSVEVPAAVVLEGSDNVAGLLLADIVPLTDRVYVPADGQDVAALRSAVTGDTGFVPELAQSPGGESESWLLWSA